MTRAVAVGARRADRRRLHLRLEHLPDPSRSLRHPGRRAPPGIVTRVRRARIVEVPASTVRMWRGRTCPIGGGGYFRLLPYGWTALGHRARERRRRRAGRVLPAPVGDRSGPAAPRGAVRWRATRHYRNLQETEARLRASAARVPVRHDADRSSRRCRCRPADARRRRRRPGQRGDAVSLTWYRLGAPPVVVEPCTDAAAVGRLRRGRSRRLRLPPVGVAAHLRAGLRPSHRVPGGAARRPHRRRRCRWCCSNRAIFGRFVVSLPFLNYGGVVADDTEAADALVARAGQVTREHRATAPRAAARSPALPAPRRRRNTRWR